MGCKCNKTEAELENKAELDERYCNISEFSAETDRLKAETERIKVLFNGLNNHETADFARKDLENYNGIKNKRR